MTYLELLKEWLEFSEKVLNYEWWAMTERQDPETYTDEGKKLKALQEETLKFLRKSDAS